MTAGVGPGENGLSQGSANEQSDHEKQQAIGVAPPAVGPAGAGSVGMAYPAWSSANKLKNMRSSRNMWPATSLATRNSTSSLTGTVAGLV